MTAINKTIEQALGIIFVKEIALHPNTVIAQVQAFDPSLSRDFILNYMQEVYGWKSNFYDYYGHHPQTDVHAASTQGKVLTCEKCRHKFPEEDFKYHGVLRIVQWCPECKGHAEWRGEYARLRTARKRKENRHAKSSH